MRRERAAVALVLGAAVVVPLVYLGAAVALVWVVVS
jgi:hypothetical protein